ncbi:HXXEE domain-containing protein [Nocardia thailandica]
MRTTTVAWGLLVAWLANDTEEWFTMAPWSRRVAADPDRAAAGPVWLRRPVSDEHAHTAIALMGGLVTAAAAAGAATGGRSRFFQAALVGFGAHGFGHLALSAAHRGYTPGVATAPTVVIPYALWAWRELGRAGVRHADAGTWLGAAALVPASLALTHLAAERLTR